MLYNMNIFISLMIKKTLIKIIFYMRQLTKELVVQELLLIHLIVGN